MTPSPGSRCSVLGIQGLRCEACPLFARATVGRANAGLRHIGAPKAHSRRRAACALRGRFRLSETGRSRASSPHRPGKVNSPRGYCSPACSGAAHVFSLDLSSPRRSRGLSPKSAPAAARATRSLRPQQSARASQVEASDTVLEQILVSALEVCLSLRDLGEVRDHAREVLLLSQDKIFHRAVELLCREPLERFARDCDLFFHVCPRSFLFGLQVIKTKGSIPRRFSTLRGARGQPQASRSNQDVRRATGRRLALNRTLEKGIRRRSRATEMLHAQNLSSSFCPFYSSSPPCPGKVARPKDRAVWVAAVG